MEEENNNHSQSAVLCQTLHYCFNRHFIIAKPSLELAFVHLCLLKKKKKRKSDVNLWCFAGGSLLFTGRNAQKTKRESVQWQIFQSPVILEADIRHTSVLFSISLLLLHLLFGQSLLKLGGFLSVGQLSFI